MIIAFILFFFFHITYCVCKASIDVVLFSDFLSIIFGAQYVFEYLLEIWKCCPKIKTAVITRQEFYQIKMTKCTSSYIDRIAFGNQIIETRNKSMQLLVSIQPISSTTTTGKKIVLHHSIYAILHIVIHFFFFLSTAKPNLVFLFFFFC